MAGKFRNFWKKIGRGMKKGFQWLIVWGKPIVRNKLKTKLVPKLKEKINAGAIDGKVDILIDKVVDEFCKKVL